MLWRSMIFHPMWWGIIKGHRRHPTKHNNEKKMKMEKRVEAETKSMMKDLIRGIMSHID